MATLSTKRGYQFAISLGDGGTPTEVFTPMVLLNSKKGMKFTTSTEAAEVVDATDLSKPAVTERVASATDCTIDGEGMLSSTEIKAMMDWAASGLPKNIKSTGIGGTVTGPFILSSLTINSDNYKVAEVSMTFEQAGKISITV